MNKVGILYICTGKYIVFWRQFFKSCEKYFLPGHNKLYFVFTDAKKIYGEDLPHVNKVFQEKLEFPLASLMRFEMFLSIKDQLLKMSHLYFLNANIVFLKQVFSEEIFPSDEENGLIGYQHAAFYDKHPSSFIYERNPISKAYVKEDKGTFYYQGAFIGGRTIEFLQMAETLNSNIKEDLSKDFIAIWWDESHLNHYLLNKKVKLLHPGYAYPELFDIPFDKKAILLDKSKRGGLSILRGLEKPTFTGQLKFFIKNLYLYNKV